MKAPLSYNENFDPKAEFIDVGQALATDKPYLRTPFEDEDETTNPEHFGALNEEWAEPAMLPDGRRCLRIYEFSEEDITDDNGARLEPDAYPWDESHVRHIKLVE